MTQFYCDHGAYGAGACMGTILGTTLTVASISSGRIGIGAEISGPGVTYGTYVTALMTGLGGTGTYTVSVSQTVSSANLTALYGMPLTVPFVWAQPQDGDGTATTAATASATISLDCSGYTFTSGSSQVSIMGATGITISASANSGTNAQYNAMLTTMLDNIVAAINQCAYNTVNLPANWQANQVRNTVFARRTGNSLELMTRAGSAFYNGLIGVVWAGVTGAANGAWSGGTGGCWGVQVNYNTVALPSGLTAGSGYGVSSTALLAGYATGGDVVWQRTGKLIYVNPYGSQTVGSRHVGLATALLEHRVDSLQTIWPADPANSIIELRRVSTGYNTSYLTFLAGNFVVLRCPRTASGLRSWVAKCGNANPGGGISVSPGISSKPRFIGLSIETTGVTTSDPIGITGIGSSGSMLVCEDVYLHVKGGAPVSGSYADGNAPNILMIACEFDATGTTTASTGVVSLSVAGQIVQMDGCKFSNFVSGSRLLTAASVAGTNVEMLDCSLGNIDLRGPQFGTAAWQQGKIAGRITVASSDTYRDFAMESPQGFIEWNYKRDQPLLAAKLHDGTTGWSVRVVPSQIAASNLRVSALKCPPMTKLNTLSTGARTATVEMLIASALTWTAADIDIFVSYIDSTGAKKFATSFDPNAGALTPSTAAWSKTTFVDGGTINFSKFKLSVSLPSLLTGTIITVAVRINREVGNTTQGLFYDPEFVLA